jgi:hypothetical protein
LVEECLVEERPVAGCREVECLAVAELLSARRRVDLPLQQQPE